MEEEIKKRFGLPEVTNPHNIKRKAYGSMKQDGFNTGFDITKTLGELTKLGFNWSDNKGQPK